MKTIQKLTILAVASLFVISGCGMGNSDDNTDSDMQGKANQTQTKAPQSNNTANSDSMDQMISYLNGNGITMDQMKTLDQMDFAAHEGRSFSYQGNTGYLYRLKSDDASMKALLDSAAKDGTVKVNLNGQEQNYNASVNGDYLFVYDQNTDMNEFIRIFSGYVPNITVSPKQSDEQTEMNEAKQSENGNSSPINGGNASEYNDAAQDNVEKENHTINGSNQTTNNNTGNGVNHPEEEMD